MRTLTTYTNQHKNEIIRQIGQISLKKTQNTPKEENNCQQTPKLLQDRREFKNLTTRIKLKDYIRLTEISRQKRSQSASSNSLNSNKTSQEEDNFHPRAKFVPERESKIVQQSKIVQKQPLKPYQEQIELQKQHLLLTIQKTREKFNKILGLINESKHNLSGYKDLVFMFSIEEMLNNQILNGLQKLEKSFDEHFADNSENNCKSIKNKIQNLHSSRLKQIQHMSPALRAQFKALQQIYQIKKPNIPLSKRPSITQFSLNEPDSLTSRPPNPQIMRRRKS